MIKFNEVIDFVLWAAISLNTNSTQNIWKITLLYTFIFYHIRTCNYIPTFWFCCCDYLYVTYLVFVNFETLNYIKHSSKLWFHDSLLLEAAVSYIRKLELDKTYVAHIGRNKECTLTFWLEAQKVRSFEE